MQRATSWDQVNSLAYHLKVATIDVQAQAVSPESKCQNICQSMERGLDLRGINLSSEGGNLGVAHALFSVSAPPPPPPRRNAGFQMALGITLLLHSCSVHLLHLHRAVQSPSGRPWLTTLVFSIGPTDHAGPGHPAEKDPAHFSGVCHSTTAQAVRGPYQNIQAYQ